ncbi:MAG: PatB family C-S lyase [Paludibacteraceae bacterium]|nr:PatB family C-S lyase [Paludibacteraceae bacterium]
MLEYVNRKNSDCYKWDSECAAECLPLWIADMDFAAAKPIREAMQRRLDHGVFGYSIVPQANYDAVASWFSRRHGWNGINRDNLLYTTAVVPAISAIFAALQLRMAEYRRKAGKPTENEPLRVLTFTPAYNCFFSCIENMGCELVPSPLVLVNNRFEINWADVETKAKEADVFLLCNPHNPTGRVWSREELERLAAIMRREHLFVLSDEIHCEFAFPGHAYTPFASIVIDDTDFCVCTSASKAFNIAGLLCANIFVPNKELFAQINHALEVHEVNGLNPFGLVAQVAAYNESEAWLDELNEQVYANFCYLRDFLHAELPMLQIHETEGTYLAWVNISALNMSAEQFCHDLAKKAHVLFNPSEMYGAENYVRINLATSHEVLAEALNRLKEYINGLS